MTLKEMLVNIFVRDFGSTEEQAKSYVDSEGLEKTICETVYQWTIRYMINRAPETILVQSMFDELCNKRPINFAKFSKEDSYLKRNS